MLTNRLIVTFLIGYFDKPNKHIVLILYTLYLSMKHSYWQNVATPTTNTNVVAKTTPKRYCWVIK